MMDRRRISGWNVVVPLLLVAASWRIEKTGVVGQAFKGESLLPTLERVSKSRGPRATVAPVLYIGGPDYEGFELASSLFDVGNQDKPNKAQVRMCYGAVGKE